MKSPALTELLDIALDAAHLAGRVTLGYFNAGVEVETKSDDTPVTRADREAEAVIRRTIARHHPDHAILGEEQGATPGDARVRWIIDPIDGTKSFIHGVPLYGVLIGVEVEGIASVGVIHLPALGETVWAALGHGCRWNGRVAKVSEVDDLGKALVVTSSISSCLSRSDAFGKLCERTRLQRTWGDAFGYAMVATGRADIMVDPKMNPWDCAPMAPILAEAGGHFTTWAGDPTIWGPDAVGVNGKLRDEVMGILGKEKRHGDGAG